MGRKVMAAMCREKLRPEATQSLGGRERVPMTPIGQDDGSCEAQDLDSERFLSSFRKTPRIFLNKLE